MNLQAGDLIKTADGYYGIVLGPEPPNGYLVLLGNGLRVRKRRNQLTELKLPRSESRACFPELVTGRDL